MLYCLRTSTKICTFVGEMEPYRYNKKDGGKTYQRKKGKNKVNCSFQKVTTDFCWLHVAIFLLACQTPRCKRETPLS